MVLVAKEIKKGSLFEIKGAKLKGTEKLTFSVQEKAGAKDGLFKSGSKVSGAWKGKMTE